MTDAWGVLGAYVADALGPRFRTREALLAWQDRRVRRHLRWLRATSSFYGDLYANLDDAEWRHFPTIDKTAMMRDFDRLNTAGVTLKDALRVAERAERERDFRPALGEITVGLSSGTSGARGVFLVSRAERVRWAGVILRRLLPGPLWRRQRVAFFLRANSNLYDSVASRRLRFEFFDLAAPLETHFPRLHALHPTVIVAPPSVLRLLAETGPNVSPTRVVSVAEVLEPQDRAVVAARFGSVFEVYQATEGFLGVSCRLGTLHLNEDLVAFDFENVGEERVSPIVTDFSRRTQPIVRYRLNDVLVPKRDGCACGSPLLAIERIEGRADDVLELGGRRVFPDFVRKALMSVPSVREYRARQVGPNDLEVELLPNEPLAREGAEAALRALAPTVRVTFVPYAFRPGARKLRRVERAWRP
ncbi:F390 synthetase-related protein [Deinococcus yavapaiensis]|uniref:Putative adenylate-forming enzyme n=1 Tax=Deinococcus yavapaiensis KR-236 TaxID=694435 RepID=A0A318SFI6_9DEIO|nr:F390 synthetase-related protein [Deinococcus yavapaiensis]PYE56557.1 putative adenylate-forming enzyme [Deinococcus yavapaiensis KR-236]